MCHHSLKIKVLLTVLLLGILFLNLGLRWTQGQGESSLPKGAIAQLKLESNVYDVKFSPDGCYLAVGSSQGIELRDVETLKLVRLFQGHTASVLSVDFSSNGDLLASGSQDHTIKLWDVATGRELHTLRGHTDNVWTIAFSPCSVANIDFLR